MELIETKWMKKVKPYLGVIALQFGYAGMNIISMFSLKRGLSHYVFVVYRHAAATIVIAPFALLLESKGRPKMTVAIFLRILALAFLEPVLDQNMYILGMKYTSAAFASVAANVVPAVTFILALFFRLEHVKIKRMSSKAKIMGTIVTLIGATIMAVYKGPVVNSLSNGISGVHPTGDSNSSTADHHWLVGTLLLLGSTISWAAFFVLLTTTSKQYPAELSLTSLICGVGMVEGAAVALVFENDRSAWLVGLDSRLLASVYSGVICSGFAFYVQSVISKERGPVFVTAFSPLAMIITAVFGTVVLGEQIHLGSIIGAMIIVVGLYCVVWGKSKDHSSSSSTEPGPELPIQIPKTILSVDHYIVAPHDNPSANS